MAIPSGRSSHAGRCDSSYVCRYLTKLACVCRQEHDCILQAQVNDNYCNCMSGRDEPGTSACSQQGAGFVCTSTLQTISTSFVQDGVRLASRLCHCAIPVMHAPEQPHMGIHGCSP